MHTFKVSIPPQLGMFSWEIEAQLRQESLVKKFAYSTSPIVVQAHQYDITVANRKDELFFY